MARRIRDFGVLAAQPPHAGGAHPPPQPPAPVHRLPQWQAPGPPPRAALVLIVSILVLVALGQIVGRPPRLVRQVLRSDGRSQGVTVWGIAVDPYPGLNEPTGSSTGVYAPVFPAITPPPAVPSRFEEYRCGAPPAPEVQLSEPDVRSEPYSARSANLVSESRPMTTELVASEIGDKWTFTRAGTPISSARFEQVRPYSEGRAAVLHGGVFRKRWGFIDETGEYVIQPAYTLVRDFTQGLAAACVGTKCGYLRPDGETAIPARFNYAGSFDDRGVARVYEAGRWLMIDRSGVPVELVR